MPETPEVGLFSRVADSRIVRGLLLPFGELSRPSVSDTPPTMFSADSITLPRDPSIVTLNVEHDRFNPIGRAVALEKTEAGVVADFAIANTDEGDAYLSASTKRKLSAELAALVRNGSQALRSKLVGATVCDEGAFASAALFSLAPGEGVTEELTTEVTLDSLTPEVRAELQRQMREEIAAEIQNTEETQTPEEETMTAAAAPAEPQTPASPALFAPAAPEPTDVELHAVFSAMSALKNGRTEDSESALLALADIKTTDAPGAGLGAGVNPPAWVGRLWQGKRYVRKFIDLATHVYGPIDLGGQTGYTFGDTSGLVKKRTTGEKTELPTGSTTTGKRSSTRDSYGYAADIAQEWAYLNGGAEVMQQFWQAVADSYAKVTDIDARDTLIRVAMNGDGAALSRRVAPASLPAGTPANSAYYPGVVQLIQAIEAISDADDDPAWAIVNPVLWSQLIYTPKDLLPEFITLSVTPGSGQASVDGKVVVKKAPQAAFPGTNAANPQVAAGAKAAVEFKELGETPIQIDAVNVAKFGLDRSIVGFLETFVVRPESTVFIGTPAT